MFSDKQVYEAAVAAGEARGEDYVYKKVGGNCVYGVYGEPSCLVGQIVYNLDPDLFAALEAEDIQRRRDGEDTTCNDMPSLADKFSPRQMEALRRAQGYQDLGYTWGAAFLNFAILDPRDAARRRLMRRCRPSTRCWGT